MVLMAILAITGAILFIPSAQTLLKFGAIAWGDMALAGALGALLLAVLEGGKLALGRFLERRGRTAPLFRDTAA
jgi:Ca2+-transporting ATPase